MYLKKVILANIVEQKGEVQEQREVGPSRSNPPTVVALSGETPGAAVT
jgi:hypothetical protein